MSNHLTATDILEVLFWTIVALVFYTYVLFPLIISLLSKGKKLERQYFAPDDPDLPVISVLISAFNEQEVIEAKILDRKSVV